MAAMVVISLFLVKTSSLPTTSWLPAHPPPSHPVGVLLLLATPVKNYLKWQEIQLAIQCASLLYLIILVIVSRFSNVLHVNACALCTYQL